MIQYNYIDSSHFIPSIFHSSQLCGKTSAKRYFTFVSIAILEDAVRSSEIFGITMTGEPKARKDPLNCRFSKSCTGHISYQIEEALLSSASS